MKTLLKTILFTFCFVQINAQIDAGPDITICQGDTVNLSATVSVASTNNYNISTINYSPESYYILREEGTERAFSSKLNNEKGKGIFHCAGCDLPLFSSDKKYDSGTGPDKTYFITEVPVENIEFGSPAQSKDAAAVLARRTPGRPPDGSLDPHQLLSSGQKDPFIWKKKKDIPHLVRVERTLICQNDTI